MTLMNKNNSMSKLNNNMSKLNNSSCMPNHQLKRKPGNVDGPLLQGLNASCAVLHLQGRSVPDAPPQQSATGWPL
jgi:hypothetical protein